jgi:hypothetical protein
MKLLLKFIPLLVLSLLLASCADQLTDTYNADPNEASKDVMLTPGELSEEEAAGLIYMRQEEKVARDVYTVLGQEWNLSIFTNIVNSEQSHMDAVKKMIVKYELEDPVISEEVGVFSNPVFQQMFDDFVLQGLQSPAEAMLVGQDIETQDIADLNYQLTFVDNMDIIKMYNKLLTASERHLSQFSIHITPAL